MTTETRTVEIPEGTIEYETVACAFCGESILTDETVPVVVGGNVDESAQNIGEVHLEGTDVMAANFCPACAASVFGYERPSGSLIDAERFARFRYQMNTREDLIYIGLILLAWTGVILSAIAVVNAL